MATFFNREPTSLHHRCTSQVHITSGSGTKLVTSGVTFKCYILYADWLTLMDCNNYLRFSAKIGCEIFMRFIADYWMRHRFTVSWTLASLLHRSNLISETLASCVLCASYGKQLTGKAPSNSTHSHTVWLLKAGVRRRQCRTLCI